MQSVITNSTNSVHCYEFAWGLTNSMSCKFIWSSHVLLGSLVKARWARLRVRARTASVISINEALIIHSIDYTVRAWGHWSRMNPETLTAHNHPGPAIECLSFIPSIVRIFSYKNSRTTRMTETSSLVRGLSISAGNF